MLPFLKKPAQGKWIILGPTWAQKWHILKALDLYYRFFEILHMKETKKYMKVMILIVLKSKLLLFWKNFFRGNKPIAALRILFFYTMNRNKRNIKVISMVFPKTFLFQANVPFWTQFGTGKKASLQEIKDLIKGLD